MKNATTDIRTIENLSLGESVIHRIHPMAKLITTLVFIVVVVSFNRYSLNSLLYLFAYPIILMALSDTPYKPLLKRLAVAMPFGVIAGFSNIFFDTMGVEYGVISFISILLKLVLTVMAVFILVATTTMTELSYQLTKLHVPSILILQITMTYRYITVLIEEASTMFNAYIIRSKNQKGIKMKHMGTFLGQLLLRSIDKADHVYCAMKCRGFHGEYSRTCTRKIKPKDLIYCLILSAVFIFLRFFDLGALL